MGAQRRIPRGEFLISGSNERRAKSRQLRVALGQIGKQRLDCGTIGKFAGFFGQADHILQTAKEEDFDANGLCSYRHRLIVSRRLA